MARSSVRAPRIAGLATTVPNRLFDNLTDAESFPADDVKKVVAMAGIRQRHIVSDGECSSDLCVAAANDVLAKLGWDWSFIELLVFVTHTPDYLLPATACVVQNRLELPKSCAAFDVGLGCSGYPYGLWIASSLMAAGGIKRALVLHGETSSRITRSDDRAVFLLFGDAGSATALEARSDDAPPWYFDLQSDGSGAPGLMIEGGGFRDRFPVDPASSFVRMDGAGIFNFTIREIPALIRATLEGSKQSIGDFDQFVFHQSNQFIIKHLVKKCGLPTDRVPLTLDRFGNTGGVSLPLTITQCLGADRTAERARLMLLGYGVGLSWGSAVIDIDRDAAILHRVLPPMPPPPPPAHEEAPNPT